MKEKRFQLLILSPPERTWGINMKVTGIIAEYNPLHNGHQYHMSETRRITDADFIVAVISGDFVQRGAPAVMDKYLRTEAALKSGVDLVLELPLFYAAGSAEYFAMGAVTLLDKLGCVDALCFGSECGSIGELSALARIFAKEPEDYRLLLQKELKKGHSFPKARSLALEQTCLSGSAHDRALSASPNNILGMEYLKSLRKRGSVITPHTIGRKGSGYHDKTLPLLEARTASASAIRHALKENPSLSAIRPYVPESVYHLLDTAQNRSFPLYSDDFSSLLHYKLLQEASAGFACYLDVSGDLSGKICRNLLRFTGYESFCRILKSKDITYARLSRSLLHILLHMTQAQMEEYIQNDYIAYARILGFRQTAAPLLKALKTHASVPAISKLSNAKHRLDPTGLSMLEHDIRASHIYRSVAAGKYHVPFVHEYAKRPVIV